MGLVQHPRKRKRNRTQGVLLGADFDGCAGRVMAPRCRVLLLSIISMSISVRGTITQKLLSVLLGCWIHVLMFRRCLFAIVDQLFKEESPGKPDDVFCLSSAATDASPFGASVIKAHIGTSASAELWRHTEQKGSSFKAQSPKSQILREHDLDDPTTEEFLVDPKISIPEISPSVPCSLAEGFVFALKFSGE